MTGTSSKGMGVRQIKEKLGAGLARLEADVVWDEKSVLYFFVEARKMLWQMEETNSYPAIKFYADWCVHPKKDVVPDFITEMVRGNSSNLEDFVKMQYLRDEISRFLTEKELPPRMVEDNNWRMFWASLINVISEQPLILTQTAVSKFTFLANEGADVISYTYDENG